MGNIWMLVGYRDCLGQIASLADSETIRRERRNEQRAARINNRHHFSSRPKHECIEAIPSMEMLSAEQRSFL